MHLKKESTTNVVNHFKRLGNRVTQKSSPNFRENEIKKMKKINRFMDFTEERIKQLLRFGSNSSQMF